MGASDNSGDIAAKIERKRQRQILAGTQSVNAAFAPFSDAFYQGRERAFRDYYLPQLDSEAKGARGDLIYNLGRSGLIDSSVGAHDTARLQGSIDSARKGVFEGAKNYAAQTRATIEGQRAQLLRDVESGAGVGSSGAGAAAAAQLAVAPPQFSPLGNIFSNLTGGAANTALVQSYGGAGNPFYSALLNLLPGQNTSRQPTYSFVKS